MSRDMWNYGRRMGMTAAEQGLGCMGDSEEAFAGGGAWEYEGVGFFDDEDRDGGRAIGTGYVNRYGGAVGGSLGGSEIASVGGARSRAAGSRAAGSAAACSAAIDSAAPGNSGISEGSENGRKKRRQDDQEPSSDEKGISTEGITTKGVSRAGVTTKGVAKDKLCGRGSVGGDGSTGDDEGADREKCADQKDGEMPDIIRELGLLGSGNRFVSDLQYISIIGSIEGHSLLPQDNKTTKYEHLIPELIAVEENPDIKGLLLILNTVGGDVEAGLALSELVAGISKPTVSLVIGGGHSIGIPLAVSADYSFVAKSATMTLHPIRTIGTVITAEPTFEYMKRTQERVVDFIVEHSHAMKDDIEAKMNCTGNMANDVGTLLFGPDAVEMGLIDSLGSLSQALKKLRQMAEAGQESGE